METTNKNTATVINGWWDGGNYQKSVGLSFKIYLGEAMISGVVPLDDEKVNELVTALHKGVADKRTEEARRTSRSF